MFPAGSLILFTTASGTGYGLVFLTIGADCVGLLGGAAALPAAGVGGGLALATAGLLASLAHLGHPLRAWRAFGQWRSSWLSREGVFAVACYGPAAAWLGVSLSADDAGGPVAHALGGLAMACCLATVYCTAMIYASLKAVHAWHTPLVPCATLALALTGGAVMLTLLSHALGGPVLAASAAAWAATALGALAKALYWRRQARARGPSTAESATGLGGLGRVRQWAAPHGPDAWLLKEMGYRVAREKAALLRPLAALAGFAAPAVLIAAALAVPGAWGLVLAALAAVSTGAGLAVERWLFFAEARHAATLYYGRT